MAITLTESDAFLNGMFIITWPSNMTSLLVMFIVGLLSWLFCVTVYRRYFSALSDIPGPFWASFSRLWHLSITIQGNQNEQLAAAHEKYGHFVRLANNEISISHPDAVKRVLLATLEKVRIISLNHNLDTVRMRTDF